MYVCMHVYMCKLSYNECACALPSFFLAISLDCFKTNTPNLRKWLMISNQSTSGLTDVTV